VLLAGVNDDEDTSPSCPRACSNPACCRITCTCSTAWPAPRISTRRRTAAELHAGLLARLPGYLVPRLVREVAGAHPSCRRSGLAIPRTGARMPRRAHSSRGGEEEHF
jgi:L-lysine 2,3-aminomutase